MHRFNTRSAVVSGLLVVGSAACSNGVGGGADPVGTVASALTTTYQAENAFDIEEGVVETEHAGFTGTGYVNVVNAIDSRIWNVVTAPAAGSVTLSVRYANGDSSARPIQVVINGANGPVLPGSPTGAWTAWATASARIDLASGNNDLLFWSTVPAGLPNIDKFDLAQTFTRTYQAENAFDIDEGVIEAEHAGFTGTGYLNINNFNNTFAWYIVSSPAAATVAVAVRYANGTSVSRPFDVHVGGGTSVRVAGVPTGSWSTWTTATVSMVLGAGDNDFFLSSVTADGMPNIDKFAITW